MIELVCLLYCISAVAGAGSFFVINDIHFDAYYNPNADPSTFCRLNGSLSFAIEDADLLPIYGQFGCDSPYALVENYFQEMKKQDPSPDFILLLGDISGHHMSDWTDTVSAVRNVTVTLQHYFPGVMVFPLLGNNDVWPDYQLPIGSSEILTSEYDIWTEANWMSSSDITFLDGGFYSFVMSSGLKIIALNTVYYSKKWCADNTTACADPDIGPSDPAGQFAWMTNELEEAQQNGQSVYILGHIPPGEGVDFKKLWQDEYVETYVSIISMYSKVIVQQFFSHMHRDDFRLIYDDNDNLIGSILLSSSLTPKDLNNPSFRIVAYDTDTFEVQNYLTYYLTNLSNTDQANPPSWELEYSFVDQYNIEGGITYTTLEDLYDNLAADDDAGESLLDIFINFWAQETTEVIPSYPDNYYTCAIRYLTKKEFDKCTNKLG